MLPRYKSEITLFIESLKKNDPTLEERQREGLHLLWDKTQDLQLLEQFREARVPQKPYVYEPRVQQPKPKDN